VVEISIIIGTFDRRDSLRRRLGSIAENFRFCDVVYEVIIANSARPKYCQMYSSLLWLNCAKFTEIPCGKAKSRWQGNVERKIARSSRLEAEC
jgi:hypothetical protein